MEVETEAATSRTAQRLTTTTIRSESYVRAILVPQYGPMWFHPQWGHSCHVEYLCP
jgi:hypothetical protein